MNNRRQERINDEVRREIAEILRNEVNDPRVTGVISVMRAEVTQDLKYCKAYLSVLGGDEERSEAMKGVNAAGGYIRRLLAERVNLRQTPEIQFIYDDAIERGIRLSRLIDEVNKNVTDTTVE